MENDRGAHQTNLGLIKDDDWKSMKQFEYYSLHNISSGICPRPATGSNYAQICTKYDDTNVDKFSALV